MHFGIYVETREAWRTEGDTVRTMKTKVKSSVFMSAEEHRQTETVRLQQLNHRLDLCLTQTFTL